MFPSLQVEDIIPVAIEQGGDYNLTLSALQKKFSLHAPLPEDDDFIFVDIREGKGKPSFQKVHFQQIPDVEISTQPELPEEEPITTTTTTTSSDEPLPIQIPYFLIPFPF